MGTTPTGTPTFGLGSECVNCGAKLSSNAKRCHVCGAPAPAVSQQRRCPNCGTPAAQRAETCLMCNAPLDHMPFRRGLTSVWVPWIAAVALIAALTVIGWNHWHRQAPSVAALPTTTARLDHTPTSVPPTPTPTYTPSATPTSVASPTPIIHEVQSGETVIFIASYYGTSPEDIMEANGLDEDSARLLQSGQKLLIPSTGPVGGPVPQGTQQPPLVIHEVVSGETLISIAYDYDTTVETIMAANNLDSPDLIYVGQQLLVPLLPPTSTPTPYPSPTPSSTPGPPYSAPTLLSPADGALFEEEGAAIVLTWASVGILRQDQAYLVELETPGSGSPVTHTTQGTSWRLPSELWPTGPLRTLAWRVTVVQGVNPDSDQPTEWNPRSLPSETRQFTWQ